MLSEGVAERSVADSATSFDDFATRNLESSYRIAALILGDAVEAEDATHDAFVSAWRNWSTVRDPDRLDAWFGRILVNRCRDQLRRARRRRVVDISPELLEIPSRGDISTEAADREAVARAFATLEPDHRICVVLRYYGDLTVRQIADRTGVPEGTVKSRLHYALQAMRVTVGTDETEGPA